MEFTSVVFMVVVEKRYAFIIQVKCTCDKFKLAINGHG
jgi:hypothetical protein